MLDKPRNTCLALGSNLDRGSFLVPSKGFTNHQAALDFASNRDSLTEQRVTGMDDNFAVVTLGRTTYVPRISHIHGHWLVGELMGSGSIQPKPVWEVLRKKDTPRPSDDSFNVMLLVAGPRQFSVYNSYTRKHPAFWYSISNGARDCFAVWGREDGSAIGNSHAYYGQPHVVAARSGRGVLFSRTANFSNSGQLAGYTLRLLRLEFSILDKAPDKDDMLRVRLYRHLRFNDNGQNISAPAFADDDMDAGWRILVERARLGFDQFCEAVPQQIDELRKFFVEQRENLSNDRQIFDGTSFGAQVKKLDWEEALNLVSAPWQLQIVIQTHCGSQFDESPHRFSAKYTRVANMLHTHKCTTERRNALRQMVDNYVSTADELWNYTGD